MGNRWGSHKAHGAAAKDRDKEAKESCREPKDSKDKDKTRARGWSISSLRRIRRPSSTEGGGGAVGGRRMSWVPRPHLDTGAWLGALGLHQYGDNFSHFGGVEDFLYCDDTAVLALGVRCPSHRAQVMASLRALRDKYEKNHRLKGVDVKPRISLVEDREACGSTDFISVIHTPLPPTPSSPTPSWSLTAASPTSTTANPSIYSPVRKQSYGAVTDPYSCRDNNFNNRSFKKSFISSDSLHNSKRAGNSFPNSHSLSNAGQKSPTHHSNLSISHRGNSSFSESRPEKCFSSNPNILSDTSLPVKSTSSSTSSYSTRSSNIQQVKLPTIPCRSNSATDGNISLYTKKLCNSNSEDRVSLRNYSNGTSHAPATAVSYSSHINGTSNNCHSNVNRIQSSSVLRNSEQGNRSFNRSFSTRSAYSHKAEYNFAGSTPVTPRTITEEQLQAPKSPLTIAPADSEDVILRENPSTRRRDHRKRTAGLLSPGAVAKMSFNYDSGLSLESADKEDLNHLLEWELSLDSSDLRSHAWYHGSIPRGRAEEVVQGDGQFLVRDCTTQPGNYVLTCCWDSKLLHFVIQKSVVQPDTVYERIQYELEDDSYDTIPDLICAYVGNKRLVTHATGAKIVSPVNRTKPLSYYESLYKRETVSAPPPAEAGEAPGQKTPVPRTYDNRQPLYGPAVGVSCAIVRSSVAEHQMQQQRPPALAGAVVAGAEEKSCSTDGIICHRPQQQRELSSSTQSLPRRMHVGGSTELSLPATPGALTSSIPSGGLDTSGGVLKPPPKPSRVPSFKVKARKPQIHVTDRVYAEIEEKEEDEEDKPGQKSDKSSERLGSPGGVSTTDHNPRLSRLSEVYQPSGSDSGNGSGDSIQTTASDARNRDSQGSLVEEGGIAPLEDDSLTEDTPLYSLPDVDPPSCFALDTFNTFLLPHAENPPLDSTALNGVRNTLMETGSRILASHLTYADLEVLNGLPDHEFGLGVTAGIELITLPQGAQLRKDLIERTECMRLLVAVTVLKADDIRVRAEVIHRWIQVAIDTKTATGNLYGFNNIMLGLCNPQIQRLTATWHMVRQKFTDSAFSFESKLRLTLKAMNECNNPQAPNTIIPHILPFMMLCERDLEDIYSLRRKDESLLQWESTTSDYGLQMLLQHLQEGRSFAQHLPTYSRNAELILDDPDNLEDLILDVFRTEFHLKFLFGSRGALRDSQERHAKFNQILSALSAHCESAVESSV